MLDTTVTDEWLRWMRDVRRCATGTIDQYAGTIAALAAWADDVTWQTLDARTIEQFVLRPRRGGKAASDATMSRERATLKSLYSYLLRRGIVSSDPTFDVPIVKVRNRNPKAIDDSTWQTFWSSPIPREDRVWIGLGAFAGLRRREIVTLAPSQVDMDRGLLVGVTRKGGSRDVVEFVEMARIVHQRLPQVLPDLDGWLADVRWLSEFRKGDRSIVTHGDVMSDRQKVVHGLCGEVDLQSPQVLNMVLRRLLRAAGLHHMAFTPHALRHTAATNLLRAGVPMEVVADSLGHSTTAMTMRYSKTAGRLAEWRESLT